jgi:hypothetical protein
MEVWGHSARPTRLRDAARAGAGPRELRNGGRLLALALGASEPANGSQLDALQAAYYGPAEGPVIHRLQRAWAASGERAPLAAAVLHEGLLYLAHEAGARAYLLRQGALYRLTGEPAGAQPGFYRPVICRAGDRLLLADARLGDALGDDGLAGALAMGRPQFLELALQRAPAAAVSLLAATLTAAPPPERPGRANWQTVVRLSLLLAALLQLAALLTLRWLS